MGRKLQTIYEYFSEYTPNEIEDAIFSLPIAEMVIIRDRYGNDLKNPKTSDKWNKEKSLKFYGTVIPKLKRILSKNKTKEQNDPTESQVKNENSTTIAVNQPIKEEASMVVSEPSKIIEVVKPVIEIPVNVTTLLQMLNDGKSNNEICEKLNINMQQLSQQLLNLKNIGIIHKRKYYSDGSIKYSGISSVKRLSEYKNYDQDRTLITDTYENDLKILLISDLHFGNEYERIDLINHAYEYCAKNGINIILCGGDLVDGSFSKGTQKISNLYEQIEYFIRYYPYDKNILTFAVAGDHDISVFHDSGIDLIEMCNNYRQDIIIGGYNNSSVNIKNDKIHLYHHIENAAMRRTDAPIILHGHSHKLITELNGASLNITLPTLSNILQSMPSVLEMNIHFNKGYIENTTIKHIYFGTQDIILSEMNFDLLRDRNVNFATPINNVEAYKRVLKQDNQGLSQIEKFNRRYGLK